MPLLQGTRGLLRNTEGHVSEHSTRRTSSNRTSQFERAFHLHFVVGEDERVDLDGVNEIGVVADHAGQLGLADLVQLLCCHGNKVSTVNGQRDPQRLGSPGLGIGRPRHSPGVKEDGWLGSSYQKRSPRRE